MFLKGYLIEMIENLDKRLAEVSCVIKKMDKQYLEKIPKEVLSFIDENKDINWNNNIDINDFENINIDTVAILTYINTKYLLEENEKRELIEMLNKNEKQYYAKLHEKYNSDNLFKNKNRENKIKKDKEVVLTPYEQKNYIQKILEKLKRLWNKIWH